MKTPKDQPRSDLFKSERMEREEAEARTRRLTAEHEKTKKKTFEIRLGHSKRVLRIEPGKTARTFAVFAADREGDWINQGRKQSADIPESGLLGTITVHSAKKFEFDGLRVFTGAELESLAAQLVLHPQFKAS